MNAIKLQFFLEDVDTDKVLVSNSISSDRRKNFYISTFKSSLHLMLPKISAFVKGYEGQNTWIYFLIDDNGLFENIIQFGTNSALILKKNLIANLLAIKISF